MVSWYPAQSYDKDMIKIWFMWYVAAKWWNFHPNNCTLASFEWLLTFIQKIPESSGYPIKLVVNVRNPQFLQAGAPVRER